MPTPTWYSNQAYDGILPGVTWDDFINGFKFTNSAIQGNNSGEGGGLPGLNAGSYGDKTYNGMHLNAWQQGGTGSGLGQQSGPPIYGYMGDDLGNGTRNEYTRGPNGEVISKNNTINSDSWWDSTGLPLVASLAFGGATSGLSAAGIGVSGAGAGATNVGMGLSSLNLPGSVTSLAGNGAYLQNLIQQIKSSLPGGSSPETTPGGSDPVSSNGGPGGPSGNGNSFSDANYSANNGLNYNPASSADWLDKLRSGLGSLGSGISGGQALSAAKTGGGILSQLFGGGSSDGSGSGGGNGIFGTSGGGLNLANLLQGLGQTAGGILSAQEQKALGDKIVKTVDPFNQYRQQYAGQLNGLVQSPGYADKFSPTNVKDYLAQNTPQGALAGLNAYQTNPNVANSFATMNGLNGANGTDYNALNGIGTQYANLLKDPNQIFNDTAYKAQTAQGTEALNRTLASRGQTSSGNEMQALQDYGTANSAQYYNNRLSQLGTGYNQNIGALGQQFNQAQSAAGANLARDSQQYGQTYNTANANLQAQNLGYNQQSGLFGQGLAGNQAQYGQLAQMSGLSQANLGAAGMALSQQYGNVQNAYGQAGQGLYSLLGGNGTYNGVGSLLGQLGSGIGSLFGSSGGSQYDLNNLFGQGAPNYSFDGLTNDTGNAFLNALGGYGQTNGGVDPISLFGLQ